MSVMVELDPTFVKALKLLQSKAKDSGAQLKAMLDDAIAQRKGLKLPSQSGDAEKLTSSKSRNDDDTKKKDADKRPADKSVKDSSESDHKKAKLDSSKQKSSSEREAREKEKERERSKREKEKKEKEEKEAQRQKDKAEKERREKESMLAKQTSESEIPSDEEEQASQMDAGDFALEMGIACVVCKQFDVSSGNQLVECQECRSLYHQECHKPSVTGEDVSDPRFVWYCSKCTKSLKKMVTQKPINPKQSKPALTTKESPTAPSKPVKSDSSLGSQVFRKIDPKAIVTPKEMSNSSSAKPMVGLAGLAANLAKPRGDAKHSGSLKKTDQKGDGGKSSTKTEGKQSSSKQDSSSKSSSSSSSSTPAKSDSRKSDGSKSSSKEEKEKERKSDSKTKNDDKRSGDSSSKSSSSSKDDKKSDTKTSSASEKKGDSSKSSSSGSSSKMDSSSSNNSPPQSSSSSEPAPTKGSNRDKQAVANLSMVTANKRIQMMKKKAQTKPQEKKVHIK